MPDRRVAPDSRERCKQIIEFPSDADKSVIAHAVTASFHCGAQPNAHDTERFSVVVVWRLPGI
jgi:hypothetical protein